MRRYDFRMKVSRISSSLLVQVRSRYWNLKVSYLECTPLSQAACSSLPSHTPQFLLPMEGTRPDKEISGEAANTPSRAACRMKVSHFVCAACRLTVRSRYWNFKMAYLECTPLQQAAYCHYQRSNYSSKRIDDNQISYRQPQVSTFGKACIGLYPQTECAEMASGWKSFDLALLPAQVRSRYWNLKVSYPECTPLSQAASSSLPSQTPQFLPSMEETRPNTYSSGETANRLARVVCRIKVIVISFVLHVGWGYVHGIETLKCHTLTAPCRSSSATRYSRQVDKILSTSFTLYENFRK